jgi:D-3-phosphoglycerate dehydrogenase
MGNDIFAEVEALGVVPVVEVEDAAHAVPLQHERVLATPHIGGYTTGSVRRATTIAVENLLAVLGPPP